MDLKSLPAFLTTQELADLLRRPIGSIRQMNYRGTGPARIKAGRACLYAREDVISWLNAQRVA